MTATDRGILVHASLQIGTQYVFNSWQDGIISNPRVFPVPAQATIHTASFNQQSFMTTVANPPEGGAVSGGGSGPWAVRLRLARTASAGV